jgi:hypothetical protein
MSGSMVNGKAWATVVAIVAMASASVGAGATSDVQMNTITTGDQTGVRMTRLANGAGGIAVWETEGLDGSGKAVAMRRFDAHGVPLDKEFQVNSWTTADQYNPAIAASPEGGFIVTWASFGQDGDRSGVFAQRFDDQAQPVGTEFRVNTFTYNYQGDPAVASLKDGSGGFVVVWRGYEEDIWRGAHVLGQRFDSSGAPLGSEFQVEGKGDFTDQKMPVVASLPDGDFVVAWTDQNFLNAVLAQRFDHTGTPRGKAEWVNATSDAATSVDMCTMDSGEFVVAWAGYYLSGYEPVYASWARIFDPSGSPLVNEFRADRDDDFQYSTSVACASDDFATSWSGDHYVSLDVFVRRFNRIGEPETNTIIANRFQTGMQFLPALVALADGSYLAAWSSRDQDGSGLGVFARRVLSPDACVGDCDNDACVTVNELVRCVNIALGTQQADSCRACDGNSDGHVTTDELVKAVNAALNGCVD